jgi:hypothetical protein
MSSRHISRCVEKSPTLATIAGGETSILSGGETRLSGAEK